LIEAMARGLPCIGSKVGGIPELLEESELVQPGKPQSLASKLIEVLRQPKRLESLSCRNRSLSLEYRDEVLKERRRAFYRHVLEGTKELSYQNPH